MAALFVAGLLFGLAHAYQGPRGVLQTGVVGLGLAVLYVFTGSLWVPMALHAFVDLNSGLLAYAFLHRGRGRRAILRAPPEARRDQRACGESETIIPKSPA